MLLFKIGCKGTKKNPIVQENVYFLCKKVQENAYFPHIKVQENVYFYKIVVTRCTEKIIEITNVQSRRSTDSQPTVNYNVYMTTT